MFTTKKWCVTMQSKSRWIIMELWFYNAATLYWRMRIGSNIRISRHSIAVFSIFLYTCYEACVCVRCVGLLHMYWIVFISFDYKWWLVDWCGSIENVFNKNGILDIHRLPCHLQPTVEVNWANAQFIIIWNAIATEQEWAAGDKSERDSKGCKIRGAKRA